MDNVKVIQTKATKEFIKAQEMRCSQEYIDELNDFIINKIQLDSARAKLNGRNTVQGRDV